MILAYCCVKYARLSADSRLLIPENFGANGDEALAIAKDIRCSNTPDLNDPILTI